VGAEDRGGRLSSGIAGQLLSVTAVMVVVVRPFRSKNSAEVSEFESMMLHDDSGLW
jgi:hypothetical protein